ncbi:hypothetical protein BDD12DRAFT_879241 [Trichophaea hybrida]|nr:hypothetical protein BDD12DRAFT_879241 [Trichophaea hybrida]
MPASECQILSSVIVTTDLMERMFPLHHAMNRIIESNLLQRDPSSTPISTSSVTTTGRGGDPMKQPDFDKTNRKGKEQEKTEKGYWRHGQNNAIKVEAATSVGAPGEKVRMSVLGMLMSTMWEMPYRYAQAQCACDKRVFSNARTGTQTGA